MRSSHHPFPCPCIPSLSCPCIPSLFCRESRLPTFFQCEEAFDSLFGGGGRGGRRGGGGETLDTQKWLANHACLFTSSGWIHLKVTVSPVSAKPAAPERGVGDPGSGRTSWSQTVGAGSGLPPRHHPLRVSSRLKGNLSEPVCSDPSKQPGTS